MCNRISVGVLVRYQRDTKMTSIIITTLGFRKAENTISVIKIDPSLKLYHPRKSCHLLLVLSVSVLNRGAVMERVSGLDY